MPGVMNIRDYAVPEPGFYTVLYNYGYSADQFNNRNGDEVTSITINPGPGPGVTIPITVDVDVYAVSPTLIWVSDWTIFGAKYGAYIAPTFANSSVGASLGADERRFNIDESQFGIGDLYVQPLWLGWTLEHWDFALGYGFYAPVGKYDTETINLPIVGPVTTTAADNIGLGFWTHQIQGGVTWYPWSDKRLAINTALTYELHHEKEDIDVTPGQNLTLNWGVSQYLPLRKDQTLLLEIGPSGYSSWQITDDKGSAVRNPNVHDQVHAAGGQIGLSYVPWNAALNFRYLYEFSAEDRFQGQSIGVNFAIKF